MQSSAEQSRYTDTCFSYNAVTVQVFSHKYTVTEPQRYRASELQVSSYRATQILVNYRATGQVYSHIATQLQIYKAELQDAKVKSKVTGYRIFLENALQCTLLLDNFK